VARKPSGCPANQAEHWIMYFDGSLKLGGGGVGVLFISPRGEHLKNVSQILFEISNNEADYEALLHGLRLAISLSIKRLLVYSDSLLVVQRVNKDWDINTDTMDAYIMEIRKLENKFSGLEIHHVIRNNNVRADVLSKLGSDRANVPPKVFVHELHHPSVKAPDSSIAYSTLMHRTFLIPQISSIYIIFIHNQTRHLLTVPGDQYFQYNSVLLIYEWYYAQVY
jgi:ribonuclease HI